jgi:hypothetical protein
MILKNNMRRDKPAPTVKASGAQGTRHKEQGTRHKEVPGFIGIAIVLMAAGLWLGTAASSCNIYRFKDVSIPDSIKTVKIELIENHARYINPQLSPRLTDKFRQKITSQTKLTQRNSDNTDWVITGIITDYSFSTSAITNQQASNNRLNVTLSINVHDNKSGDSKDYQVTRSFDFRGDQTLQQAENTNMDEWVKTLADDIFNKIFSNW